MGAAVYFFCTNAEEDPTAPLVFEASRALLPLAETEMVIDGYPVLMYDAPSGDRLYYARTKTVLCMDFEPYVAPINQYFADCELAVLVNWHGGANAPDKLLCIHTVGDPASGSFPPSRPIPASRLAQLVEACRVEAGLTDFTTTTEATHWSGIVYNCSLESMMGVQVPFLDLEVGSTRETHGNPAAAQVLAMALARLYDEPAVKLPVMLYCGGMHFEDTITGGVLHPANPVALTHILPTRVMEGPLFMDEAGAEALRACVNSIAGGIDGFVIHEKLKKEARELVEAVAGELNVPVTKRKAFRSSLG